MSLFKKFGHNDALSALALHIQQQEQQMAITAPPWGSTSTSSSKKLDIHERTQLALQQLQILFSAGELEKHELLNATRMTLSLDRENLVVVEEIIKSKLG